MNPLRTLPSAGCRPVEPACIAPALASLTRVLGCGRRLPLPDCGSGGALHVWPVGASAEASDWPAAFEPPGPWVLQGDQGPLWLGNHAQAWLAGVTGVDIRAAEDTRTRDWLRGSALALLPPPWRGCFHTLASNHEAPPNGLIVLRLDVRTEDHVITTHGWAAANTWLACLAGWPRRSPANTEVQWMQWPAREHVLVARHRLPVQRAQSLRAGDIVVPSQPQFDSAGVGLWHFGLQRLRVQGYFDRLEVLEMLDSSIESPDTAAPGVAVSSTNEEPPPDPPVAEDSAGAGSAPEPSGAESMPSPLQALPLTLEFSLGCVRSTLGELSALAPGTVLALERAWAPGCVSVRVGEREVGLGELVQVQGQLAVRLTEWGAR
jgi:type III secretion protein Q